MRTKIWNYFSKNSVLFLLKLVPFFIIKNLLKLILNYISLIFNIYNVNLRVSTNTIRCSLIRGPVIWLVVSTTIWLAVSRTIAILIIISSWKLRTRKLSLNRNQRTIKSWRWLTWLRTSRKWFRKHSREKLSFLLQKMQIKSSA